MSWARKLGKWAVIIYIVQALVGVSVGVYFAVTLSPADIERMLSCVTHQIAEG